MKLVAKARRQKTEDGSPKPEDGSRKSDMGNKSKWENLSVPFPNSKIEQQEIVKKLDLLSAEAIKLQKKYSEKFEKLEELKSGILKRAFENELIKAE